VIGSTRALRVFADPRPTDLRCGFDGLCALVVSGLGRDPLSGDCFLFTNRSRTRAKVLLYDGTGLCLYHNQPSSHYTSFDSRRASWSRARDAWIAAARSRSRSQRLQCLVRGVDGSS
jgi:hypothetical protein